MRLAVDNKYYFVINMYGYRLLTIISIYSFEVIHQSKAKK